MSFRFHLLVDLGHAPFRIDEKRRAMSPHRRPPHEGLLAPDAVGANDLFPLVGEEGEGEVIFLRKSLVAANRVHADAEDGDLPPLEFRQEIAKAAGLLRAARRVVPWIEVEDYPLSSKVREPVRVTMLIRQGKVRSELVDRHFRRHKHLILAMWDRSVEESGTVFKDVGLFVRFDGGANLPPFFLGRSVV